MVGANAGLPRDLRKEGALDGKKPHENNGKVGTRSRRLPQAWLRMDLDRLKDPAVVEAVKAALLRISGVKEVAVDLHARTVTVRGQRLKGPELTAAAEAVLKAVLATPLPLRSSRGSTGRC